VVPSVVFAYNQGAWWVADRIMQFNNNNNNNNNNKNTQTYTLREKGHPTIKLGGVLEDANTDGVLFNLGLAVDAS